jgi:hypothetical protein
VVHFLNSIAPDRAGIAFKVLPIVNEMVLKAANRSTTAKFGMGDSGVFFRITATVS